MMKRKKSLTFREQRLVTANELRVSLGDFETSISGDTRVSLFKYQ